jgi:hypothetical protein
MATRGDTPQRVPETVSRDIWGWGPLRQEKKWGDRATALIQHIWICGFPDCVADLVRTGTQWRCAMWRMSNVQALIFIAAVVVMVALLLA